MTVTVFAPKILATLAVRIPSGPVPIIAILLFEILSNLLTTSTDVAKISIDAISSREIRFYKVDVSQDYTYPNNNNSIVTITSE